MIESKYTILYCTDGWLIRQINEGSLPDVIYDWIPWSKVEEEQSSGGMIIVAWTDPEEGTQHWISHEEMPDSLLMAFKDQWDEVVSGRRGQTLH